MGGSSGSRGRGGGEVMRDEDRVGLGTLRKARRGVILRGRQIMKDMATEILSLRRQVKAEYRHGRKDGLEEAAKIVCPKIHVEEERSCHEVAQIIRTQKKLEENVNVWPVPFLTLVVDESGIIYAPIQSEVEDIAIRMVGTHHRIFQEATVIGEVTLTPIHIPPYGWEVKLMKPKK